MTNKEVTEYLKQVSILESAIYKQEEMIKAAKKNLKKRYVSKPTLKTPKVREIMPPREVYDEKYTIILILAAIVSALFILIAFTDAEGVSSIVFFLIGFCIFIVALIVFLRNRKQTKINYECRMQAYQCEKDTADKAYQEQLARNKKAYDAAIVSYRIEDALATENYQKAVGEVQLLDEPLADAKRLLSQLYEKDVVFPKYRNMIAVCTMYEYFSSGRCSELTGANGAYNMYEQELRQIRIIDQLEQVNSNLEQIKQSQYILYQTISETNQALQEISTEVKSIVNAVTDIAVSSRITAYCSQITAVNAQVQTYIALSE